MSAATETLALAAVAVLSVLLVRFVRRYLHFRKLELALPGAPSIPVLGNALSLATATPDNFMKAIKKLKGERRGLFSLSILGNVIVCVCGPDEVDETVRRKDLGDKSVFFYSLLHFFATKGLIQVSGAEWKMHRKWLAPGFNKNVLNGFVDIFSAEAQGFVERVVPDQDENVLDNVRMVALRNFLRTTMSDECAELKDDLLFVCEFAELFLRSIAVRSFNPLLWPDKVFQWTPLGKKVFPMVDRMHAFCDILVKKKRQELESANNNPDSFDQTRKNLMDILLDPSEIGRLMPDQHIIDEFKTFLIASVETSESAMSWLLKVLSLQPEVQDKAYTEAVNVLGDRDVTFEDIPQLPYLERVIKETMRMFPPVPFVARQCHEETTLCGHTVPANSTVAIGIYFVHRDPRYWPNPDAFDPDRFLPENSEGRHPSAYIPFSAGPRNCIGSKYAMMSLTTFLATLLRAYKVLPTDDYADLQALSDNLAFDVSSRLVGGIKVRFQKRAGKAA